MGELNPSASCTRCGKCCHYYNECGVLTKCSMLVKIGNKTLCRIYKNRLGHEIAKLGNKKIICIDRKVSVYDYPECPYNTNKEHKLVNQNG